MNRVKKYLCLLLALLLLTTAFSACTGREGKGTGSRDLPPSGPADNTEGSTAMMPEAYLKNLTEKLLTLSRQEIQLRYHRAEQSLAPTASKIGGSPAVPAGFEWPCYTGVTYSEPEPKTRPLSFLAQINLKEIAGLDEAHLLPERGVLSFFYELDSMTWGFLPSDRGSARVYYFPDESALQCVDAPPELKDINRLPELAVEFRQRTSLPSYMDYHGDEDMGAYDACRERLGASKDDWGEDAKLLGYPDVIQDSMESECEALSRGYPQGSPADYAKIPEEEKKDILEKSKDWTLLFQLSTVSDGDFKLMFGDCGNIYFWIRKSDLADCRFEDCWLILQCY